MNGGTVALSDYRNLGRLPLYRDLEKFSDDFLRRHREVLRAYSRSWVADPFHQWSRRWEYPWVAGSLPSARGYKVLDAGSGLTFFPFFLKARHPDWELYCLDSDPRLVEPYRQLAKEGVRFTAGSLQQIPFPGESFDALYCISVLEHTGAFEEIAREFHRVLRPGGTALITFDVCLNGVADISPGKAAELLEVLQKYFVFDNPSAPDFTAPDLLRTTWIRDQMPSALPWRFPRLSALKAAVLSRRFPAFIDLTIYTVAAQRRKLPK